MLGAANVSTGTGAPLDVKPGFRIQPRRVAIQSLIASDNSPSIRRIVLTVSQVLDAAAGVSA